MLAFLRKLFNRQEPNLYKGYEVAHYPATAVFAASFKGDFLKRWHLTGIVEVLNVHPSLGLLYGDHFTSQEDAWALVGLHIEQRGLANVKVYTR